MRLSQIFPRKQYPCCCRVSETNNQVQIQRTVFVGAAEFFFKNRKTLKLMEKDMTQRKILLHFWYFNLGQS